MSFDNLLTHPGMAGMRALPQWIVWQLVDSDSRPGKKDKVPVNPLSRLPVSAHKPQSWMSIEAAIAHARSLGNGYGVGFVFTPDCGYWFLDLDSCLVAPDVWSPLAMQMCTQVLAGAAVEVSISGTGLHLFGRGTAPPHSVKNNDHHAEFYSSARFCATTGISLLGNCDSDHTAALAWIVQTYFPPTERANFQVPTEGPRFDWRGETDDEALVERMLNAPPRAGNAFGGKAAFRDLWTRNVEALSRAFPSSQSSMEPYDPSSADAALAAHLAYETGCDVQRIERLMRRSALVREKWDIRPDYLVERTIMFVCQRQERVRQDPLKPDAALKILRDMDFMTRQAQCVSVLRQMSKVDAESILDEVNRQTEIGLRPLRTALNDARKEEHRERKAKEIAERAGPRMLIQHRPEACTEQAAQVEGLIVASALPGEYVAFAGALSHVTAKAMPFAHMIDNPDEAPPDAPQLEPLNEVAVLAHVERVAVFYEHRADEAQKPIAVPERLVRVLVGKTAHAAPVVAGLVTHPIVLPSGEIMSAPGLHAGSAIFLWTDREHAVRPYTQIEATAALARLRAIVLDGFEFASPLDADVALAGLFTGVERRVLDQAPGLAVLASTQSSGKTTLARRIHVLLTGRDMPAMSFPHDNETEVAKQILSTLLRGPAMVCFDNVPDGFAFRSGVLAAAMTSQSIDQRLLGASRDVSAPTNTLFAMTGNNLTLGPDEISRWLVTRLAPKTARPEERTFAHPEVVAHALANRALVLRDVVGIVAGYIASGASCAPATRFARWDRMVRQPLWWAGAQDVAQVFRVNAEASESTRALRGLLGGLHELFGEKQFKARDIASPEQTFSRKDAWPVVTSALESLDVEKLTSSKAIGKKLEALEGRVAEVGGHHMRIRAGIDRTNTRTYRVEVIPA